MVRPALAGAMVACLFVAGCATNPHSHGGTLVVEHHPGDKEEVASAPYKADYVPYRWPGPPPGPPPHDWRPEREATELYMRGLERATPVGFEADANGVVAVAGEERIPLEEGRYCWHISSDTQYRGGALVLHELGEDVAGVIALPFATVGFVCMLPVVAIGMLVL
jgi:hypothetical protein